MRIPIPSRLRNLGSTGRGHGNGSLPICTRARQEQGGMAVIVVITIVAILLIYLMGNARMLHNLGRELKLVEQQQTRRLAGSSPAAAVRVQTNLTAVPLSPSLGSNSPAR